MNNSLHFLLCQSHRIYRNVPKVFGLPNKIQAVKKYNHFSLSVTPCYKYYIVYKFQLSTSQTIFFHTETTKLLVPSQNFGTTFFC